MDEAQIRFLRMAAAIVLGTLGPLMIACLGLVAMQSFNGWEGWTAAGYFALMAGGAVLLVGLPVAAVLLRDPGERVWRWMVVGAGSAWLAATLYGMYLFGPMFPFMLIPITYPGMMGSGLMLAVMGFGAVTGLIARTLLPFLERR